jgi:hypothetical protein
VRKTLQAVTYLLVVSVAVAGQHPTLQDAVALSIQGNHVRGVQVGKHGFDLKPIGTDGSGKKVIIETATSKTFAGSFHHRIVGKNDVVYYTIVVEKGRSPRGVVTSIKYRGLSTNVWVRLGCKAAAASIPGIDGTDILDAVKVAQQWAVGSWEESAQMIVDEMAAQLNN